jgi:hypothetical protein
MPVNAEGENTRAAIPELSRLQNDVAALTNLLTVATKRHGTKTDDGKFELSVTPAELSALGDKLEVTTDQASGAVLVKVTPRPAADIAKSMTTAQLRDNARAAEVALPKSGLITPPKGIILP